MLPKKNRLTVKEFQEAFRNGKRFHGVYTTIIYMPHTSYKAAVVVSKKVTTKKPVRNTLRRRYYTLFAQQVLQTQKITGTYIISVKKNALHASYGMLAASLQKTLAHIQ